MSTIGSFYYIAPEVLKETPYSFEADIWSLGVMLYEMCALEYPFNPDQSAPDLILSLSRSILSGKFKDLPDCFSKELGILLKAMLNLDSKKRPNIHQILAFPTVRDMIKEVLDT